MAKEIICGIYKITNKINNKVYIGQSKDIYKRWIQHKTQLDREVKENSHFQNAWNKYGKENFRFKVIEKCHEDDLNNREIYWINEYNSFDSNYGYNKTTGGGQGRDVSEDTRHILSEKNMYIHRGEKSGRAVYTDKQIRLCKMLVYCYMKTEEISDITGVPSKYITKIRTLYRWSHILEEYNEEIASMSDLELNRNSKPVIMFDKNFNIIKRFKSAKIASEELNLNYSNISACCNMKIATHSDYIWLFDNEDLQENIEKKKEDLRKNNEFIIHRIDNHKNIIETFNTGAEVARKYNLDGSSVLKASKTGLPIKGYIFKREYLYK